MKQEKAIKYLNGVLSCKLQSLASYIFDATPYIIERDFQLWDKLKEIAKRGEEVSRDVAQAIRDLEAPPTPGMRDVSIADINYLSLAYLAPMILKSMQHDLEFLRSGLPLLEDHPSAKELIERLIEEDEADCQEVETLASEVQRQVEEERAARKLRLLEEERKRQEAEEAEKQAKKERLQKAAAAKKAAAAEKAAAEKKESGDAPATDAT